MSNEPKESIVDATVPSAGRMYDYMLGGHHNFEVDRMAVAQLVNILPFLPTAMRLQRWCLQDVAAELAERRGFEFIIDFASGLPTQDHLHLVVPNGTRVVYSDYDPVVVKYAREILGDTPDVYYLEADARRPEELLNHPQVREVVGQERNVGLVFWGISSFLTDDELQHAAQVLYQWAGPQAVWAFNAQAADVNPDDPVAARVAAIYQRTGSPLYPRSLQRVIELVHPWRPENSFVSLFEWHGIDPSVMSEADRRVMGSGGAGYGAYFIK